MVDTHSFGGIDVGNVGRGFCLTAGQVASGSDGMIEAHLKQHLEPVAQRHRSLRLWVVLGICWLVMAIVAIFFLLLQRFTGWSDPYTFASLIAISLVGALIANVRASHWQPDYRQVVR